MIEGRVAIISDIHGNSIALREVLKDIKNRNIKTIINLGDSLYGPLDPIGTFDLLEKNEVISISGNEDRIILENLNRKTNQITLEYVKSQIDNRIIDWLKDLPFETTVDNRIYCCHATPQSDSEYLLEKIVKDYVAERDKQSIEKLLFTIKQNIVACGHSHLPRIVATDNKVIINPGSVGLPAYDDNLPVYHKVENYNLAANYAVLNFNGNLISVDRISIDYDHEKTAKLAETHKRDDWARWIRTGCV